MNGLKIGITFNPGLVFDDNRTQTALNLYKTLCNSTKNYDVFLLNLLGKPHELNEFRIVDYNKHYIEMDLLIIIDAIPNKESILKFKEFPSKKIVKYFNENTILNLSESIIHNKSYLTVTSLLNSCPDEIWHTPRCIEMNKEYIQSLFNKEVTVVPFIWDSLHLDKQLNEIKNYGISHEYSFANTEKTIGIFQSNNSIDRTFIIPSMIADLSYNTEVGKEKIEKMNIFCFEEVMNNYAKSYLQSLNLFKDNLVNIKDRLNISVAVAKETDVLICNQLQNMDTLSYIYMDAIHMGYPVLHNASGCKHLGYYYKDIEQAVSKLNDILLNHDKKVLKYNKKNRENLNRYKPVNHDLITSYDFLISNIWKKGNSGLKLNLLKNIYV